MLFILFLKTTCKYYTYYSMQTVFLNFHSLSRLVIPSYSKPLPIIVITLFQNSSSKDLEYLNYQSFKFTETETLSTTTTLNKAFRFYLLQRHGKKLKGNWTTQRGGGGWEKEVWRSCNEGTTIIQASSARVIITVPEASLCHTSLHPPDCHKSVLSVCNCISKCNTRFLPRGDILIYVFKTGSSAVTQCCKGEALPVPESTAAKDSSGARCTAAAPVSLARVIFSLFSTLAARKFIAQF